MKLKTAWPFEIDYEDGYKRKRDKKVEFFFKMNKIQANFVKVKVRKRHP